MSAEAYCGDCGGTGICGDEGPGRKNSRQEWHPCHCPLGEPFRSETRRHRGPKVVCLCGSTRFYEAFQEANYLETMAGNIVLSVGFYPHSKAVHGHGEGVGHDSAEKVKLDELHLRKIDLADEVLILNVGGYIGASTARELAYAREQGKAVRFLEPQPEGEGN